MMVSKSSQIGLLFFAILAISVNFEKTSAQNPYTCWQHGNTKVSTNFHTVFGTGLEAKCTSVLLECEAKCKAQGRNMTWSVCQWRTTQQLYACTACCGFVASPPPPPPLPPCLPSPPPPSPPAPELPPSDQGDDVSDPAETFLFKARNKFLSLYNF
ncbi:hypothetical protein MKW92_051646 [Papaver armeniacum]|nr:hypothetical protein MKW92_051646 [Papaver armeniacum]